MTFAFTLIVSIGLTGGGPAMGAQPAEPQPALAIVHAVPRPNLSGRYSLSPRSAEAPVPTKTLRFDAETGRQFLGAAGARAAAAGKTEIICGLVVMQKSPNLDARMLLPPTRSRGLAVRRIEPNACTSAIGAPK
jgi:hypothetical protein